VNIIVSSKDIFDLSIVLMQNAFEVCHYHLLMFHDRETFCHALLQLKLPTKYSVCCFSSRLWSIYVSPSLGHCCCQFCSGVCSHWLCWTCYTELPLVFVDSQIWVINFHKVVPLCMMNFIKYRIFRYVQWFDAVGSAAGRHKKVSGRVLAWLYVWGEVQISLWPRWCHCLSLFLAPVNPDWFFFLDEGPLNDVAF